MGKKPGSWVSRRASYRDANERRQISARSLTRRARKLRTRAARCMDCGVPFGSRIRRPRRQNDPRNDLAIRPLARRTRRAPRPTTSGVHGRTCRRMRRRGGLGITITRQRSRTSRTRSSIAVSPKAGSHRNAWYHAPANASRCRLGPRRRPLPDEQSQAGHASPFTSARSIGGLLMYGSDRARQGVGTAATITARFRHQS